MAQKKMGRPKTENPLDYEVKTRVDAQMYADISNYCEQHEIGRAVFARKAFSMLLKTEDNGSAKKS